tara:strand:+ start:384 stop:650 length:267 start_codon:yes stop_codon:yes gene_type:complete
MIRTLNRLFVDHPREVGESYIHHLAASFGFALRLLGLAGTAVLHGLVPGLHRTTVSSAVCAMAEEVDGRAKEARDGRMREAGVWDPGL